MEKPPASDEPSEQEPSGARDAEPGDQPGRFARTFARRPRAPHRGMLPSRRVWGVSFGAPVVAAGLALAMLGLSQLDLSPKQETLAVSSAQRPAPSPSQGNTSSPSPTPSDSPSSTRSHSSSSLAHGVPSSPPDDTPSSVEETTHSTPSHTPSDGEDDGEGKQEEGEKHNQDHNKQPRLRKAKRGVGYSLVHRETNRCIDISGGKGRDGDPLQLFTCNNGSAQQWKFFGDGTIRAMGKCMDAAGAGTDAGTVVQLANCNGNEAQHFTLNNNGKLRNSLSGKCVDARAPRDVNGAGLFLWGCGSPSQRYALK